MLWVRVFDVTALVREVYRAVCRYHRTSALCDCGTKFFVLCMNGAVCSWRDLTTKDYFVTECAHLRLVIP